jgi:hypothetical protein
MFLLQTLPVSTVRYEIASGSKFTATFVISLKEMRVANSINKQSFSFFLSVRLSVLKFSCSRIHHRFWVVSQLFMSMGWNYVSELRTPTGLLFIPWVIMSLENHCGIIVTGKSEELGEKLVSLPLLVLQLLSCIENCLASVEETCHFHPTLLKKEHEAYEITKLSVCLSPTNNFWTSWRI